MADEAILRIIIQDGDSQKAGPSPVLTEPAHVPVTESSELTVASSRALRVAIDSMTADIYRATSAIRQMQAAPMAHVAPPVAAPSAPPKVQAYTAPPEPVQQEQTPYQQMRAITKRYRAKFSKEEIAEFSPKQLEAYMEEQNQQTQQMEAVLNSARLTKREKDVARPLFLEGAKGVDLSAELGVNEKRISALKGQVEKKLQMPKGVLQKLAAEGVAQAAIDQGDTSGIDFARQPIKGRRKKAPKDYIPVTEQLYERLTDHLVSQSEESNPDPEYIGQIQNALTSLLTGEIDDKTAGVALKKKKPKDAVAALIPHLADGGIPALLGTPTPEVPTPPTGWSSEMMSMYPKDAMQVALKQGASRDIARSIAEFVYNYSLHPENVYKRVLGNIGDRSDDVDMDSALAATHKATDFAKSYGGKHYAEGGFAENITKHITESLGEDWPTYKFPGGQASVNYDRGSKELTVDNIFGDKIEGKSFPLGYGSLSNVLGISGLKALLARIKEDFPEAESIGGLRVGGTKAYEPEEVRRHLVTGGEFDPEDNPAAFMDDADFADVASTLYTGDDKTEVPEHHATGLDAFSDYDLEKGDILYHASPNQFERLHDDTTWFTPHKSEHQGYLDLMREEWAEDGTDAVAHSYSSKFAGGKLAKMHDLNSIASELFNSDFVHSMLDPNTGDYSTEEVAKMIFALKAKGFIGATHTDYASMHPDHDSYATALFNPNDSLTDFRQHHASGGRVNMTQGGTMPNTGVAESGADWHPAWLTNREFVINATSSERNRDALTAANANPDVTLKAEHHAHGFNPLYHAMKQINAWTSKPPASGIGPPTAGIIPPGIIQGAEILGGPVGQVAALAIALAGHAQKEFQEAVVGATRSVGEFAQALADPDANPAKLFVGAGDAITTGGEKLSKGLNIAISPLTAMLGFDMIPGLKLVTGVVGETAKQFGVLMDAINATSARYGEFNAPIAVAQAMVEVQHTMGELRRANEAGPQLAQYLRAQGDLQQKIEDIKIKLLLKLMPLITIIVTFVEKAMPAADTIGDAVTELLGPLTIVASGISRIAGAQEDANLPNVEDPTNLILNGTIQAPDADL